MAEDYNRLSKLIQTLSEKSVSEEAIKIFYSYSRKDLDLRNRLENHLAALRKANRISTWHDLQLEAGTEWEPAILNKLDTADIILLLISSDFIDSEYCYGTELKRAIARHDAGTARVIPIILRPCDWNHSYVPFSKLNVLPTHAQAITKWEDRDEAFAIVAQRIRETVDQLNAKKLAEQQAEEWQRQQLLAQQEAERRAGQEQLQQEQLQVEEAKPRQVKKRTATQKAFPFRQLRDGHQLPYIDELKRLEAQAEQINQLLRERKLRKQQEKQRQEEERKRQMAQTVSTNELVSERGIDYTRLQDLLKAGQWKEADQETAAIMIRLSGGELKGRFQNISTFPCKDLLTIDRLWQKYSQSKFGFTVQKDIWSSASRDFKDLARRVGWYTNSTWVKEQDLKYTTTAPRGHLPTLRWVEIHGWAIGSENSGHNMYTLLEKLLNCQKYH